MSAPLRLAVIGCNPPGAMHAAGAAASGRFVVSAVCDIAPAAAADLAGKHPGARPYTDLGRLLDEVRPDAVAIATNETPRPRLALQCIAAGVRGIYAEKPMAVHLRDARAMAEACRKAGGVMLVNHQRRTLPVFRTLRRLIEEGAIGKVEHILVSGAGDILSDGTHGMDVLRFLNGDAPVRWLLGQVYRTPPPADAARSSNKDASGGFRYGHAVETGALAVMEFANGVRAEFHCGEMFLPGRWYQDYEVFGTAGRLRRNREGADCRLMIQTDDVAGWREVDVPPLDPIDAAHPPTLALPSNYVGFADALEKGLTHPLDVSHGLAAMELCTAVYESARLNRRVTLPVDQGEFPLDLLIREGRA
jgi:UDP-N-acetyl-2-amino-2-deoxyglucuronate dehydrogenase